MNATLTSAEATTMSGRLDYWLSALETNYSEQYPASAGRYTFEQQPFGQKYSRIVQLIDGKVTSVHAFIDKVGNVYKAASWKSPAKGIRFSLLDDESFMTMLGKLDWPGQYLCLR